MVAMRIPFTQPLPVHRIIPPSADSLAGAVEALRSFLCSAVAENKDGKHRSRVVLLTGAGISVESGLADYRGEKGLYRRNSNYKPIFYSEFVSRHGSRQRYWARSLLGWSLFQDAKPNRIHRAVSKLADLGIVGSVVTQNVDSFHQQAHPSISTIPLHGSLSLLKCVSCSTKLSRQSFQMHLKRLNPTWTRLLDELVASKVSNEAEVLPRNSLQMNPDGDMEINGLDYQHLRYPPCPSCLQDRTKSVQYTVDQDGAATASTTEGILKPGVVMFGENIAAEVRQGAENAIADSSALLVVGTSLATHSAWRLATQASQQPIPLGVLNIGGVRGEEQLFGMEDKSNFRCNLNAGDVLEGAVSSVKDAKP